MAPTTAAAVAYLTFIPALIFLFSEPYKRIPFVRFHSIQCLALSVVSVVFSIGMSMVGNMLFYTSVTMLGLFSLVNALVNLVLFVFWIIAVLKAKRGDWYKIPIIGDFALKQAQRP